MFCGKKVWLARDTENNKNYVMKQIDISRMSPKEKQEAMNEVKVLAQ